jgi:hypothetical protein
MVHEYVDPTPLMVPCCPLVLLQRCTTYFSDPDEVSASFILSANTVIFSSGGAKFGEVSCVDAGPVTVCEGDTLILRPTPLYDEWGRKSGILAVHGTFVMVSSEGIMANYVGTLDFDDSQNSDIFFQDLIKRNFLSTSGPVGTNGAITGGTGNYVGATGYVELLGSAAGLQVDICLG